MLTTDYYDKMAPSSNPSSIWRQLIQEGLFSRKPGKSQSGFGKQVLDLQKTSMGWDRKDYVIASSSGPTNLPFEEASFLFLQLSVLNSWDGQTESEMALFESTPWETADDVRELEIAIESSLKDLGVGTGNRPKRTNYPPNKRVNMRTSD
ncbi:hypothetical protein FQR65_LT13059 [Abscondita terminalis]|nr:hypothetical protein FQR65_LT13059 [Abscondita terminalis]